MYRIICYVLPVSSDLIVTSLILCEFGQRSSSGSNMTAQPQLVHFLFPHHLHPMATHIGLEFLALGRLKALAHLSYTCQEASRNEYLASLGLNNPTNQVEEQRRIMATMLCDTYDIRRKYFYKFLPRCLLILYRLVLQTLPHVSITRVSLRRPVSLRYAR